MNKGLLTHLISTFIYILMVMYVYQEEPLHKLDRLAVSVFLVITNILSCLVCLDNDIYNKKINFKNE